MWRTSTRRTEGGYTLIEMAIVLAIFGVVMAIASPFMFRELRSGVRTESMLDVQQSARGALRTLVRELRQAKELYATTEKPTSKNAISFGVDLNADGVLNNYRNPARTLEQITYYWDGDGTLRRGRRYGDGQPLAEGVVTPSGQPGITFTMFGSNPVLDRIVVDGIVTEDELNLNGDADAQGNPIWQTAELANVTRVRIAMTVTFRDETQTFTADVWLRNRTVG